MTLKIFPNKIDLSLLHSKSAHCDCEWKRLFCFFDFEMQIERFGRSLMGY